ncbi:MAG: nuoN, partial [Pseudonocardiales bacterium]|nr:nuoN [Pseudonocardiales bacterium]
MMLALSVPVASVAAPSISYYALSPILIVLGTAMLGVLAEAFVPREQRYYAQVGLSIAGLIAALIAIGVIHNTSTLTSSSALAIDGFTLFLQGTILVLSILSIMLIAERSVDTGSAVVAQAAVVAGTAADRRMATSTQVQTEIFP